MAEEGAAVGIAALSSLDNLSFGVAFALKGVTVGPLANGLIASINSAGMLGTMLAGAWLVRSLPTSLGWLGNVLAGCVYVCIGAWELARLANVYYGSRRDAAPETTETPSAHAPPDKPVVETAVEEFKESVHLRRNIREVEMPALYLWSEADGRHAGCPPAAESVPAANAEAGLRDSRPRTENLSPATAPVEHDDLAPDDLSDAGDPETGGESRRESRATDPETQGESESPRVRRVVLERRVSYLGLGRTPAVIRNFLLLAWCSGYDVAEWSRRERRDGDGDDRKRRMQLREAAFIGVALTASNVAAGLAAGAAGLDETITVAATFGCSFLFMAIGQWIGRGLRRGVVVYCACSHADISLVAAVFFLGYGTFLLATAG